ncbi:SpoIIE family protein phosphatase [Methylocaldum sp.]|uniref:SpoIIE family protein phosphatase n=1 Tax=Methylocaldum sp. TaxID=1969727 RepID=UPI002D4B78B2|nr:SpoIIE family protein phosphatase [Methylocaldum sp.]HYE34069.1 SpoIIE family protein phosphatase [Methylocaldum sp.]
MDALIEHGVAARAFPGENVSGDRPMVKLVPNGVLIAAVDGLGHGVAAGIAAGIAVATLEDHAGEEPEALVQRCHQVLKGTRGVVMSLASIDVREGKMAWLGVGNVDGLLLRTAGSPPTREALLMRGGVVGDQLPPLRTAYLPIAAGDLLIFTTDGIRSDFATRLSLIDPLLRHQDVQEIADRILARFGKTTDDALVLVARYLEAAP